MYEPWLWKKGKLKKTLYFKLLAKPVFKKANVIHAITSQEKNNLKKLFPKTIIKEIPNLIDNNTNVNLTSENNEKFILFVGRLDPKKGIDLLIKAFANLNLPVGWKLKIAGRINEYKTELDDIIAKLNIKEKVEFLGIVKGASKQNLFLNAHVFVAPSFSEVIGMVNLEAAILKTPVITTYQTGLNKDWNINGGILINPNIKELTIALKEAIGWDTAERNKKGQMLYNFVLQHYSWENRYKDWQTLYNNIKNNTLKTD
jgi:glycosyltransferase involved in cell wall biosynthesis